MAEPQQPTAPAEGAEPDALDALDAALADDPAGGDGVEAQEWTPPTREEWEAQQAAHKAALEAEQGKLARARAQAKRLREGKPATATPAAAQGAPADGAPAGEIALWQARAVRTAAREALKDKGADADLVDLALARLKPSEIEFNEDDEPELDDWLDEMQERYPKLFATAPAAPAPRRPGRVDQGAAAGGQPAARPQMSLGELIIAKSEAARRGAGRRPL